MIEQYLIIGLLAFLFIYAVLRVLNKIFSKKPDSPYTRVRFRDGKRQVYNSHTNEWLLWSHVFADCEVEEIDLIESKFDLCDNTNSVNGVDICSNHSSLNDSFSGSVGSSSYSSDSYSSSSFSSGGYSGSSDSGSSNSSDW